MPTDPNFLYRLQDQMTQIIEANEERRALTREIYANHLKWLRSGETGPTIAYMTNWIATYDADRVTIISNDH